MGRAERRQAARRERLETKRGNISLKPSDISAMKQDISQQASSYSAEALMTCFALAEHRVYGFGRKRLIRTLQYIEDLMGAVIQDTSLIEEYKKQLEDETGVIIRCK